MVKWKVKKLNFLLFTILLIILINLIYYLRGMLETIFSISFFLFSGNIIDTKLTHHKYEKENYKEIFHLKNKESVNTYCVKHSEVENVKKIKWNRHGGLQEANYKVSKPTE